jgi:predicted ATPase
MIQKIELGNFKCFEKINMELGMLNIFSGMNGTGKSTVIQSILLLRQAFKQGLLPEKINLNGDYVNIGTGRELLYEKTSDEIIIIKITENNTDYLYSMKYESNSDTLALKKPINSQLSIFSDHFDYLNAERCSPQAIYPKSSYHVDSGLLGNNGQYAIHYLLKHQDNYVSWDSIKDDKKYTIKDATQYWFNEISPNIKIDMQDIENTDSARIGYFYTSRQHNNTFRPTNTGFGISYVLPVILSLVKAQKNNIIIIENPEAHLHPRGQRKVGELIALCAASGTQIIIETHSDHILNGIRIGVKKNHICNKDIKLFFFSKSEENTDSKSYIQTPEINPQGKLNYWPDGFFDEWEKALDEII